MENDKKVPVVLIILSALSFIPLLGVFFGIISIIIGLTDFKRFKLIFILGISGIGLTILIYSSLFFVKQYMEKSGKIDEMKTQVTEMVLNNLTNELENYKCKNGKYPDSLELVRNSNNFVSINDIFNPENAKSKFVKKNDTTKIKKSINYYYKLEKDSFILFSVGKDGKPFTKDDIYPHDKTIKKFGK